MEREAGLTTDWQQIGTAPKDRKFLGFLQTTLTSEIEICLWSPDEQIFLPDYCRYNPYLWHADVKARGIKITHWMRLPAYLEVI